ncbi:Protein rds1 [Venustampulla echinocandica]|uniref:Protein rds1 n=1 Tax=Venustampulla echinocandica TaxID=2656787 RepID=A0A370TI26_9HELO|nr:Protein rds1 [Venustampulla echinocandica]RDL34999.1 Protein rds1 [Venustampulla echinocandica]
MLLNIRYLAFFGVAVAIPDERVRQASASSSRSSSISSILSSFSSASSSSASASASASTSTSTTSNSTASNPQGAINTTILAPSISHLPPGPNATSYPSDGKLHAPEPAPYTPAGGLGTNGSEPVYVPQSDFDFESLALVLYQEYIELDLFRSALKRFSVQEFEAEGINSEYRELIRFMSDQEVGHATMVANILGPKAPQPCNYSYPFTTVGSFIDYSQKSTRYGESGVLGFLAHLNSRPAASLLSQSITTESRQQAIFRQFKGLFPMPIYFVPGIPQSWHWTLLAPSISSCPSNQTRLIWQNFPALTIGNNPNSSNSGGVFNTPAISHNLSNPLTYPGREVQLSWELPGKPVGPDKSYITNTTAGAPKFVAWVSSLNVTYSPLKTINNTSGTTIQPNTTTLGGAPAINGTMFIAVTDTDLVVTPFNLSMINPHVVAGPALYQAG